MTSIVISSGHGKYVRGASGYLDEVDEARRVVEQVATYLQQMNVPIKTFHDNTSTSQSQNLSTITNYHNAQSRDLDVSVHFNAYETTSRPMGVEVLYVSEAGRTLATELSPEIADAGGFLDRGPKKRTDLAFLNNTEETAILIETCFVDSSADANLYRENFDFICRAIAQTISGESIPSQPPGGETGPEPTPPGEPVVGTIVGIHEGDPLNVRASASSTSTIIGHAVSNDLVTVVGSMVNGDTKWLKCKFGDDHMAGVAVYGWVSAQYVQMDAEPPPLEGDWHDDITATEFGGGSDEQDSAYPDIDWITSSTRGVALPFKWETTPRPLVIVKGPSGEIVTEIVDLGPWNLDDEEYVLGTSRPLVESQYQNGTEAQNGQVPSNDAAIDLTPPIAAAVGISGKGKVSWRFA